MVRATEPLSSTLRELDFQSRADELLAAHRARRPPRYRSLVLHWLGRWLRRPGRPAAAPLPGVEPGQVGITFAGHATTIIRYADLTIACDPMLGSWVKGIKRAVAPGVSPADLHDVNLILISHRHSDHLHRPTLDYLPRSATIIVPPRTAHHVSDLGFARVVELGADQSIQDHGVDITTARACHGDQVDTHALSYVIRGSGPSTFFCGDSGYFPGFAEIGARFRPDIAVLPIGGYAPLSFRDRHMSPLDALYALEDLGARVLIPIHHGSFALSYEHLHDPARWLAELVRERGLEDFVVDLAPGESRVFVPPRSHEARFVVSREAPDQDRDRDTSRGRPRATGEDEKPLPALHPAGFPLPTMRAYQGMLAARRPVTLPASAPLSPGQTDDDLDLVIDVDLDLDLAVERPREPLGDPMGHPAIAMV